MGRLGLGQIVCLPLPHQNPNNSNSPSSATAKTIAACIDELLRSKSNANRRQRYIKSLEYYLRQFARAREDHSLSDFTANHIEDWLHQYPSAYSRQTWLNRLSTLFAFATRRGIVATNPCDKVDRVIVDKMPPRILTNAEAELLLKNCQTSMRPYLVLAMFAGIRPEEIERLDWSGIDLETKTAFVDGKTRQRRYVPLEPRAVASLSEHPVRIGPVTPSHATVRRWKVKARVLLGLERFPQDLLRHTAASYLIALIGDTGKVAKRLGNSEKTLCSHYYQPVTQKACDSFWAGAGAPSAPTPLPVPASPNPFGSHGSFQITFGITTALVVTASPGPSPQ